MRLFKRNPITRLRVFRGYLAIILVCTFLLFCFSIVSLYRERDRVNQLSFSNLKLEAERSALDLEREIERTAAQCLRREHIENLSLDPNQMDSLDGLRQLREQFRLLKEKYRIPRHFFVLSAGRLVFPLLEPPPRQTLDMLLPPRLDSTHMRFVEFMEEGQRLEQMEYSAAAAQAYAAAETLPVDPRLKAFAVFRRAEVFRKAYDSASAIQTYQYLLKSYGNQYDESQTPYSLSITTREDLAEVPHARKTLEATYAGLIEGKWELSAEQTERYVTILEGRLGVSASNRPVSEFAEQFNLARAVKEKLDIKSLRAPFPPTPESIEFGDESYQIYSVALPRNDSRQFIIGFSVSIPWVEQSFVALLGKKTQGAVTPTISLVQSSRIPNTDAEKNDILIPFTTILKPWSIQLSIEEMRLIEMAASKEVWFVGFSTFMFLSILALVSYLLVRLSWEMRWYSLRSDFVSGVSHEFKTPLSLIRLYSETLANDDQDFSPEERKNYIRIIARESERMSRLIDNVLNFSKIEQGQKHHEMKEGDLTETVQQTVGEYSEYLTWRGYDVKTSIQPDLPRARFNREQVSQMILNLMDNAAKYSGKSREIRVNAWAQNNEIVIEVRDRGLGIPQEEMDKIFQPFYRASRGTEKGGCGLGLYLVQQVINEHGGRVEVDSEVNFGSRFRLVFPIGGNKNLGASKRRELTRA